jgi:hypothetical protein
MEQRKREIAILVTAQYPLPSTLAGLRPVNSIVDVFGTNSCASSASCIAQGESRFTGTYVPATSGVAGTAWTYNNGGPMYNDISALATGGSSDCNAGYCRTSEFSPCIDNVLPVTMLSFEAQVEQEDVVLDWETAQEKNAYRFVVERSEDGVHFMAIGFVATTGSETVGQAYTYRDQNSLRGISYYRLRQEDLDGQYFYTEIKAVAKNTGASFYVSPNPNKGTFELHWDGFERAVRLQLHDIVGRLVYDQVIPAHTPSVYAVSLQGQHQGMYIVTMTDERSVLSLKMIVE